MPMELARRVTATGEDGYFVTQLDQSSAELLHVTLYPTVRSRCPLLTNECNVQLGFTPSGGEQ